VSKIFVRDLFPIVADTIFVATYTKVKTIVKFFEKFWIDLAVFREYGCAWSREEMAALSLDDVWSRAM